MKRFFSLSFILFLSGFLIAQPQFKVRQFKLDNGFTVILNEDHLKPEVFGVIVVKAGSKDDPADATGMAHYQEHMLFKGTEELGTINWELEKPHIDKIFSLYDQLGATTDEAERKKIQEQINEESLKANEYAIPNELSNIIKSTGGTKLNANTGPDRTVYFNAFPSNQLEKWLDIYCHRFEKPVFRGFQSELEVVYEEKNLYSDQFQFSLIEEFNKQLYKKHPYGQQSMIGTVDDLKNPSLTKMYEFFKTQYVPENMALILAGDFDAETVMPMIMERFGRWKSSEAPQKAQYAEDSFKGREFVEKRLSPIKLGLLGFRTVPNGHPDETALDVCNGLLSNKNETGLLDKLTIDNKLLAAMALPMRMNDYGASIFFIVPKVVGQKLEDAEKLVMTEIEKLSKGEFDESMIEVVKNQLYVDYQSTMESLNNRAVLLAENFAQNKGLYDVLYYPDKVKKVTKEDVLRVARAYYGSDYLAFYSKMGFPKKAKIEKPGYKPVVSNSDAKSAFVKALEQKKSPEPAIKYIDFSKDIAKTQLQQGVDLYFVKNPVNDIFSLDLQFGIGDEKLPMLKYASQLMNYAGTEGKNIKEFKQAFAGIGCSYSVSSDDSYLNLSIEGMEANLPQALGLLGKLMQTPVLEQEKIQNIVQGEKTNRKMERSEPDNVADALIQYVKYGKQSSYLNRLSMKEIKALNADSMEQIFRDAQQYAVEIHYTGQREVSEVSKLISDSLVFAKVMRPTDSPIFKETAGYPENIVFFVPKKKAIQSKIFLFSNGPAYTPALIPGMEAFNLYFGGDFSGLVLQEIREYRSLAYTAGAGFSTPSMKDKPSDFNGYVGTQADKTIEALTVFNDLIRSMPEKADRFDMIRQYLLLSALTKRPDFRNLSKTVNQWQRQGFDKDPLKWKLEQYAAMNFRDISAFYEENLKSKPMVYAIVGDPSKLDLKEIAKFGKVVKVKEAELFGK
jgi:predicted Zn-dependent peptidase